LIAFAFTSAPALLLHKWSEKNLGSLKVMALALLIGGIVMWIVDVWSDRYEASTTHVEEMSLPQSHLDWSLPDALSGLSRKPRAPMSTIAAGQIVGLDRPAGAGIQLPALDSHHDRRDHLGSEKGSLSQRWWRRACG